MQLVIFHFVHCSVKERYVTLYYGVATLLYGVAVDRYKLLSTTFKPAPSSRSLTRTASSAL